MVLVPTLILLEQWYKQALSFFPSVYKIGTDEQRVFDSTDSCVICIYNSFSIVKPFLNLFHIIFLDEGHRIFKPMVYLESDLDNSKYIESIRTSVSTHRSVIMSATIDPIPHFNYYSYPLRNAIQDGYLCDYQLICPIFNDDPSDRNIAEYIIKKGETHCIIYTSSISECESFTNLLNVCLPNSAKCIDSYTSKKEREQIIRSFEEGSIRFLVNVRVLNEGFNAPICSSILFLHLSSNNIFVLQCIGRALRLHPDKTIANIYLPFNTEKDEEHIMTFIQQLSEIDSHIKEIIQNKRLGTYLSLEKENSESKEIEDFEKIEYRYDLIFNRMGIDQRVTLLLLFVTENKRIPKREEVYQDIKLGKFWDCIKQGRHNKLYPLLSQIEILRNDYERVQKLKEEKKDKEQLTPKQKCDLLVLFVTENKRIPKKEVYQDIKLGKFWDHIKQGQHNKLYPLLSQNEILRNDYERVQKLKEKKKK